MSKHGSLAGSVTRKRPVPERLMHSIAETSNLSGLGKTSIYGEINAGRLKTVFVQGRRLVPHRWLVEWIEQLCDAQPVLEPDQEAVE
jgi:hypothetical protein